MTVKNALGSINISGYGESTPPASSKPRLKKTVTSSLSDANLEFYNLTGGQLVSTTSSDDFTASGDNITINTSNPLFMWLPPITSKNEGESYTRSTYQLQFKPKLRSFNSNLTTLNKWYFEDNTLPMYLLNKFNQDESFYTTPLNYRIGLVQTNSDELLEYNLNDISSEISNNDAITGTIDTSTLPVALTNFTLVKIPFPSPSDNVINTIYLVGGKDSSGAAVDTIYSATLNTNGSISDWTLVNLTLPVPLYNTSCVYSAYEGYLAVIGGNTGTGTYSSNIYVASMNYVYYSGGSDYLGSFQTNASILPVGLENAGVATVNISGNQYLVVAGGNNTAPLNSIYVIYTDYGNFNSGGTGNSFAFTLSQTLPFNGNCNGFNMAYYTDYGQSDTFFLLGDDGTNSYIVTFNNNLPSNDSTISTTPLTLSLNTYKIPYLGATNRNSLLTTFDNNLVYIGSNAGVNSLNYIPLDSIMSTTAITDTTDISTVSSIPLTLPDSIINNGWVFNPNSPNFYSIGGEVSSVASTNVIDFSLSNNLSYYYVPYDLGAVAPDGSPVTNPLTFVPTNFYFIDPIKVYNVIASNTPSLTPTEVYNKSITQNESVYNFGNTILNSQNESEYTETVSYDTKLNLFTLKLTIYGVDNYNSEGFSFQNTFFPFFFIPDFLFNNYTTYENSNLTSTNIPNTVYTIFENLMAGTVITGLSLLIEGTYNNNDINLASSQPTPLS